MSLSAVSGLCGAEIAVLHPFLYRKVDHSLVLAVIHSGQSRQIALAVYHLKLFDHFHRQILGCYLGVVGEKFLAFDEYLLHLLAVGCDLALRIDLHARQAFEQILHYGVGLCLI